MNKGELAQIRYTKLLPNEEREVSERTIIPTQLPVQTIRALDVSELNPTEREELRVAYAAYQEYVQLQMSKIFNFETWLEHTGTTTPTPKWRMFRSEQTEVLTD